MISITSTEINRSGRIVNDSVEHGESNSKDYGRTENPPVYCEKVW